MPKLDNFLPAGEYFICDPCYVVPNEKWDDFCEQLFSQNDNEIKQIKIDDFLIQCQNTAFGDGRYFDDSYNGYDVDAGLIGATPKAINPDATNYEVFTFDEPFQVIYNDETDEGRIEFVGLSGKTYISIATDPKEDEDDDDDF